MGMQEALVRCDPTGRDDPFAAACWLPWSLPRDAASEAHGEPTPVLALANATRIAVFAVEGGDGSLSLLHTLPLDAGVALEALHALPHETSARTCWLVGRTKTGSTLLSWRLEASTEPSSDAQIVYRHSAGGSVTVQPEAALVRSTAVCAPTRRDTTDEGSAAFPSTFSLVTGGRDGCVRLWAVDDDSDGLLKVSDRFMLRHYGPRQAWLHVHRVAVCPL